MIHELATQLAGESQHLVVWIEILLKIGVVATVFLPMISLIAMFSIWWERKVAGHIQGRLGPMHVGGWHGWSQSIADGVKLILKEDLQPKGADGFLFRLAPYLAFGPVFAAFLALPFGPQFIFENGLNIGLLYLLAILSIEVMGTILAGWGSNSKWSVYGAMREACQMVSYEVPLGIMLVSGVLIAGTLDVLELGYLQGGGLHKWIIFHNPFIFAGFFVFFIATLASNKRAPFDLPESESELVAGFHTEYSGLRFSFFFFAEYAGMFIMGVITSLLFLGGWNSPLGPADPIYGLLGYDPITAGGMFFSGELAGDLSAQEIAAIMGVGSVGKLMALNLYCAFWVLIKALALIYIQMWLRWTLPRIRIDQVLYACVKVLLPASLIVLAGAAVWVLLEEHMMGDTTVTPARAAYLLGPTPGFTVVTQMVLASVGVILFLAMAGVVVKAFLTRDKHPPKSFFTDVMPVSRDISFIRPVVAPDEPDAATDDGAEAQPA